MFRLPRRPDGLGGLGRQQVREAGGIGRRAGFRFQWGNSRGGSSPPLRTSGIGSGNRQGGVAVDERAAPAGSSDGSASVVAESAPSGSRDRVDRERTLTDGLVSVRRARPTGGASSRMR